MHIFELLSYFYSNNNSSSKVYLDRKLNYTVGGGSVCAYNPNPFTICTGSAYVGSISLNTDG
jgi:hypothetical protein